MFLIKCSNCGNEREIAHGDFANDDKIDLDLYIHQYDPNSIDVSCKKCGKYIELKIDKYSVLSK